MASVPLPPRDLRIGNIIDKTFGVLDRCVVPALIYFAVLVVTNVAVAYLSLDSTNMTGQLVGALLTFVVGIVSAYFALEVMLRKTGLATRDSGDAFVPFLILSILSMLGVMLGMILFVLPGLIIMARWSIAQPLLIARGDKPKQALAESWELTKGSEFQILIAFLVLLILPLAVMIAGGALFDRTDVVGIVVSQLGKSAMSVLALAMYIALYALIVVARQATPFE